MRKQLRQQRWKLQYRNWNFNIRFKFQFPPLGDTVGIVFKRERVPQSRGFAEKCYGSANFLILEAERVGGGEMCRERIIWTTCAGRKRNWQDFEH